MLLDYMVVIKHLMLPISDWPCCLLLGQFIDQGWSVNWSVQFIITGFPPKNLKKSSLTLADLDIHFPADAFKHGLKDLSYPPCLYSNRRFCWLFIHIFRFRSLIIFRILWEVLHGAWNDKHNIFPNHVIFPGFPCQTFQSCGNSESAN